MQASLEDPAVTQAVLVGLPDRWPLTELGEMAASLRSESHVHIGGIFVNGTWPELPAFQAGPAGSTPTARSRALAATNAWSPNRQPASAVTSRPGWPANRPRAAACRR